jgi:hypothetical protein
MALSSGALFKSTAILSSQAFGFLFYSSFIALSFIVGFD